jgi:hypothetical protein
MQRDSAFFSQGSLTTPMSLLVVRLRDIISSLIIVLPVACWLIAEWRCSRTARIWLGILCMIILCFGIFIAIRSSNDLMIIHQSLLYEIDDAIQQGNPARARRAIANYRQTYGSTHSFKAAVWDAIGDVRRRE